MNNILGLGVIFLGALFLQKVIRRFKVPSVTAFLLLGIAIGPSVLSMIPKDIMVASGLITNIALSFIAFNIGEVFFKEHFKTIGKSVVWISVFEASGAWILVTSMLYFLLKLPFYEAILFGAIASATAPAATSMVIRECRAKGPFTETLLGVVAIDDAWCIIVFALSLAISKATLGHGNNGHPFFLATAKALIEILGSIMLGVGMAWIFSKFSQLVRIKSDLLIYVIGFILFTTGMALFLHLSVLLTNIVLGAAVINLNPTSFRFFETLKGIDEPIYLLFFVLTGASLEVSLLGQIGVIGITYILFRVLGKMGGAYLGGIIAGTETKIKRYLGLGLVPQAGVALGVALSAKAEFPGVGEIILTTIVATTIVYEIFGPMSTRFALSKAGEITQPIE